MLHLCHRLCVTIGTIDVRRLIPRSICLQLIICIQREFFQPWSSSIVQPLPHRTLSEIKRKSALRTESRRDIAWDENRISYKGDLPGPSSSLSAKLSELIIIVAHCEPL